MHSPIVVLDACVLYPAPLRDLFIWLSLHRVVLPKWSDEIHDEWIRNLLANRTDLNETQLARTRRLMNKAIPDALVSAAYQRLIPELTLPDPNDRHVLALALETKAGFIATFNLRDFPASVLTPLGVKAIHPDALFLQLLNENPNGFLKAIREQRENLNNPPKTVEQYLETLKEQGLNKTTQRLLDFQTTI